MTPSEAVPAALEMEGTGTALVRWATASISIIIPWQGRRVLAGRQGCYSGGIHCSFFFPKMNDFPNLKSGYAANLAVRIVRLSDKGLKLFFFAGIRD